MRVILNTARCFLLFNFLLHAGDNVRTATATRIHTPPQIKVFLNEEVWQRAQPVTGLLQRDPDEGKPKSERTKIRVLFDHEAHSAIAHSHSAQRGWSIGLELGHRPTTFSEIDFEMSYSRVRDDEAWVMNLTDAKVSPTLISVFGLRDTEERDLTLQVYTQLFLAKGHHDNFRRVVTPEHLVPYD